MSDYFETDDVVRGYDSHIMRRILSYLKPYRLWVSLTVFALAVSTVGELAVPVLQQRVIDGAILARFITVRTDRIGQSLSQDAQKTLEMFRKNRKSIAIDPYLFVLQDQNTKISGKTEGELKNAGILEAEQWYAFRFGANSKAGSSADSPSAAGSDAAAPAASANSAPDSSKAASALRVIAENRNLFLLGENAAAIRKADLDALPLSERAAVRGADIAYISRIVLAILAVLAAVFVFTFIQTWTTTLIGQLVMKDLRLALFKKTASQSTAFLSRHPVGRLVTRLTGDVETINQFFTDVLSAFLKDFSVMAGVLITLFVLSPKLALAVLITLPPVLAITEWSRKRARDAFRRQRTASSQVNSYLSERLSGVQVVQLFSGEKKSGREFARHNNELLDANLGEMYVYATFRPIAEWLSILTTAIVIVLGANFVLNLSLSLGLLIAFITLVGMFYNPVMDIAEKYTLLQSAMAGGERVFKLLDTTEYIPNAGKREISDIKGGISFEDVHFSYKTGEEVLKGLTFAVNPGEMAAIVGYTGSGKTTITNVLTRLWDVDSGSITLDGVPVKDIPLDRLRSCVLPVLQDVFLFSGTVSDNISLGLDLSDDEVKAAARAVYADEFISKLPDGYNTELSEGATNISSGQRQLISFARVIAHNPSVVVLDEATSSIDTETERLIQLGMARVLQGRTSIVIAHRLSTIRHADRIMVLSDGRIAEEGRHDELIAKNGLYAQLYKLQYRRQE